MPNNNVLVIGASGMLGTEVTGKLIAMGQNVVQATWPNCSEGQRLLDITNADTVEALLAELQPGTVYNCSAFTDVDAAESNEQLATAVNAVGVANLAMACLRHKATLVHVSTDYVFSGDGDEPYRPTAATKPKTAYGRSKLLGEQRVAEIGGDWIIVRTSWLFGEFGRNFVDTILKLAKTKPSLKVVSDQVGCPTYAPDLAECLIALATKGCKGIYHFCNPPACTWFDLASKAVELAELPCTIQQCDSSEFPRPAERPAYSVLECTETFSQLDRPARDWQEALRQYLSKVR